MRSKKLSLTIAGPVAALLAAGLLPTAAATATAVAAPTQPSFDGRSDVREGTRAPHTVNGTRVAAPSRYPGSRTAKAAAKTRAAGVTPPVGTVRQWLASDDTTGYYRKDFTLRGVGDHIEVWVANDLAFPEGDCRNAVPGSTTVTDTQISELIAQFDTNMYPKETAAFSTPPDRDGSAALLGPDKNGNGGDFSGDGAKTVALVDNVRDDNFYTFPAAPTYIAGFFSSYLNELFDRNAMTIDAYDWTHRTTATPPDDPTADPCTSRPARPWLYEATFGHEWQHLLEYYQDPDEVSWVNEGLSDFAEALDGYSNTTATVFEAGQESHITCMQGYGIVKTAYNPNPRDCGGPQNSLTLWGEDAENPNAILADYGNAYSFMLFLRDRYGLGFLSKLHQDGEHQGLAGLDFQLESIGVHDTYTVLHDYQSMTLLDKLLDDSKRSVMLGIAKSRVTTKSLRASVNLANPEAYDKPGAAPNGADYVPLQGGNGAALAGRDLRSVTFQGAKELPTQPLAWSVVTDDPDRDGPVLWSGNSSSLDVALVTPVTVPTTDPTLRFLAKYGAETTYDYGYVSVSTDGGATYTPIAGNHTVDGPLGPGLSGTTTGFEAETYDLSAYAGQDVLISIRYVSDGGVNEGGLRVDDITVGDTLVSDGSSLEPFDSPTEIHPVEVDNWNVRLVGLDAEHHVAYQMQYNGRNSLNLTRSNSLPLQALRAFPQVVAIVAYDEPTEQVQQYAPYRLTVNGVVQPGGTAATSS